MRSERIVGCQSFDDICIFLLISEELLIYALLVVLVHVHQIGIVVHVLGHVLFLNGSGLPLSTLSFHSLKYYQGIDSLPF